MDVLDAAAIRRRLDWPVLIEAIRALVLQRLPVPDRTALTVPTGQGTDASLLVMPAWIPGELLGCKLVTFFPDNRAAGLPTIASVYLAFDGATGRLRGVLDGEELTARRTAAASALASCHLSRPDARRLLVVGTGQLSAGMALAHAAVRSFDVVEVFGRDPARAEAVAATLRAEGLAGAAVSRDLERSVRGADVVSTVTSATAPVIRGAWLKPGAHLDLVGGFRRDMREADDEAVRRASLFVDTRAGACLAGDLAQPLAAGVIAEEDVRADLADLVSGAHPGRTSPDEITLYKSAGAAVQDLAAARLALG